jgi:hypothetical protein
MKFKFFVVAMFFFMMAASCFSDEYFDLQYSKYISQYISVHIENIQSIEIAGVLEFVGNDFIVIRTADNVKYYVRIRSIAAFKITKK